MCKKNLIITVLLFLIAILGGCGETIEPTQVDKSTQTSQEEQEKQEVQEPPEVQTFNIGDTVAMGDLEMTLNGARWLTGDEWFKPDPGERWLAIDCTIENKAQEIAPISSLMMFSLIDEEAFSRDLEIMVETKGSLDGELGPGRKMRGEITFSVDEGQTNWEFIFEPNVFGFGQAIFEINESDVQ